MAAPKNIQIHFTRDWQIVWQIVTDTSVFARICDDAWVEKPLYELKAIVRGIVLNGDNHIPLVLLDGQPVGCFLICAMGGGDFEVHTCLTRKIRGANAIEAGKLATTLLFKQPEIKRLVSNCPACLQESFWFARKVGFKPVGLSENKWMRNGVAYAITKVEAQKADWTPPLLLPTLDQIEAIEGKLLPASVSELPLRHQFAPGVYIRTIFMPKGMVIIGHEHRTEHFNLVLKGAAKVIMDGVLTEIRAPSVFVSKPGVRKILEITEDMEWATVHATDETDLEKITEIVVKKSDTYLAYQDELKLLAAHPERQIAHEV